jgi:hypothetical protein
MRKLSDSIRRNAEELSDEIRKGGDKLEIVLGKAKSTLQTLNVELVDAEEEKSAPMLLPATSLRDARAALARPESEDTDEIRQTA